VQHGIAHLQEFGPRNGVQVAHLHLDLEIVPAAAQGEAEPLADPLVQHLGERIEGGQRRAVHREQDVAGLHHPFGGGAGQDVPQHQQAFLPGKEAAVTRFGDLVQAKPAKLVEGSVHEGAEQRAAGHRLAGLDALERAHHPVERQEEARGRLHVGPGVQRHYPALDVDDGRTRGAAGGARGRLDVEGIEVVVLAPSVERRLAVQTSQRAREDGNLLARIVADHADLAAGLRAFRPQWQRLRADMAEFRRVVAIKAEIVHRVAVHGLELDFLVVEEDRLGHHRPGVTTWRLVRIRPRSASTTKPVAWVDMFQLVSKARGASMRMVTTLGAMRSSVARQAEGSAATSAAASGGAVCRGGNAGARGPARPASAISLAKSYLPRPWS
jgi:hypothetical protein